MNAVIFKKSDLENGVMKPEAEYFSGAESLIDFLKENGPCEIGVDLPMLILVNPIFRHKDFYLIVDDTK